MKMPYDEAREVLERFSKDIDSDSRLGYAVETALDALERCDMAELIQLFVEDDLK